MENEVDNIQLFKEQNKQALNYFNVPKFAKKKLNENLEKLNKIIDDVVIEHKLTKKTHLEKIARHVVNNIRHKIDEYENLIKNNVSKDIYTDNYTRTMYFIANAFPSLADEIERQLGRKIENNWIDEIDIKEFLI